MILENLISNLSTNRGTVGVERWKGKYLGGVWACRLQQERQHPKQWRRDGDQVERESSSGDFVSSQPSTLAVTLGSAWDGGREIMALGDY